MALRTAIASILFAASTTGPVLAQAAMVHRVDIPAQQLASALATLARQTSIQLVYSTALVEGRSSRALSGAMTPEQALEQLLDDSGLEFEFLDPSTVTLSSGVASTTSLGGKAGSVPIVAMYQALQAAQPPASVAGPTQATAETEEHFLAEITVTATRRSESMQDVPISMSVIDEAAMTKAGVLDFGQLADRIPGLTYAANGIGQTRYFIRGVGQIAVNQSPTTGVYFDETPLQVRVTTGYFQPEPILYDLSRVEVLRGPQGSLFGSSSMGGTVRFISNKPDPHELEASVSAGMSDTKDSDANSYNIKGMINLPMFDERAALRVVALHSNDAGWIDDVRPLTSNVFENLDRPSAIVEDVNWTRTNAVRAMFLVEPSDTLRITPTLYFQRARSGANKPQSDEIFGAERNLRARWINEYLTNELFTGNLLIEKDIDALGGMTLTSSSSRLDAKLDRLADLTPFNNPQFSQNRTQVGFFSLQEVEQWTQDLRIVSRNDSPLQYVLGAYYNDTDTPTVVTNRVLNAWGGAINPEQRLRDFRFEQTEWAVYGELSYRLGDFKLAAGGRYFNYEQTDSRFQRRPRGVDYDFSEDSDEDGFSPRVVLSYAPTQSQNYYVSYAQGFRTGGSNAPITEDACPSAIREQLGIPDVPPPFESDEVKTYEIGTKLVLRNSIAINAAAYKIDWTEYQQSVTRECGGTASFGFSGNAGSVESRGFDLEVIVEPLDGLRFNGAVAGVDATFEAPVPSLGIEAGERLWDVPEWTYSGGAEYRFDFLTTMTGAVRADASYVGSSASALSSVSPPRMRESYTMVNFSADIGRDNWNLTFFINNLTDITPNYGLDFIHGNIPIDDPFSRLTSRPRTIGLTLSTTF